MSNIFKTLRKEEAGSVIRRFFINTLFVSTFMLLGVIVGSAFITDANLGVIMLTMITSSIALGISTGVSVYEAESLEQELKISKLEKAMLTDLDNTKLTRQSRSIIITTMVINFLTPIFSCLVTILPYVLVMTQILEITFASWISVILALSILFAAGYYLGRIGNKNPWIKGLRMTAFGIIAFIIGLLLESLV